MSSIMKGLVDETEAKKGADGKRCWKGKRYAGTENGKDKCIPVKNEAANPAQQAAIAVNMKKKGQKPKHVDEARAKQYVKPYNSPQTGEQIGWVSSDGYHKKYWQMFAKDSAIKHAKLNPDEVDEGKLTEGWKMGTLGTVAGIIFGPSVAASLFGDIGDHNGVNHILTVLGSMIAGGYFGKDISSVQDLIDRFTKNPIEFKKMIKQRKENKKAKKRQENIQRGQEFLTEKISQIDMVINAIRNKMYKKAATIFNDEIYTEYDFLGLTNALFNITGNEEIVTPEMKYALDVFNQFKSAPYDYSPEFIEALANLKSYLLKRIQEAQIDEDYTGEFAAEKTPETNPYGGQRDRQHRGAISETPTDNPTGASGEGGWRKYKPKSAGITESYPANIKQYARDLAREMREEGYDWEPVDLSDTEEAIDDAREQLSMFASSNMCDFFGDYDAGEQLQLIKMFNKKFGGVKEDTAYAGGGGQGGNAGESYRKFKPKSAGTFKEDEQLDEKCWKGYKKQGTKKMFGKTYPNCVKNTNEEEQLDEKCWDSHKQVGMKKKGGKMVPNCVPKESAIMKGLKR